MWSGIKSLLCLGGLLCLAVHAFAQPINNEVGVVEKTVSVASEQEARNWNYSFNSLDDFLSLFKRPSLTILSSGETKDMYYAFARHGNDLYKITWPRQGTPHQTGLEVTDASGNQDDVLAKPADFEPIILVNTAVKTDSTPLPGVKISSTNNKAFFASRLAINPNFHGPLKARIVFWNDNSPRTTISDTFPWK